MEKLNANIFWDWSIERYRREGVDEAALKLQDECGFNINILLWCCWTAEIYPDLSEMVVLKAIEISLPWAKQVTIPLRRARQALKFKPCSPPNGISESTVEHLRQIIKEAELEAEKIEETMLESLTHELLGEAGIMSGAKARARRNLETYALLTSTSDMHGFHMLFMEPFIQCVFPYAEEATGAGLAEVK